MTRLPERLAGRRRQDARDDVGRAARRERHQQRDGAVGIGGAGGGRGGGREGGGEHPGDQHSCKTHARVLRRCSRGCGNRIARKIKCGETGAAGSAARHDGAAQYRRRRSAARRPLGRFGTTCR